MFFEIVESGLSEKFEELEITRIKKFCASTKGEIPPPIVDKSKLHDPCEEYVEGLTAQPFWSNNQHPDFTRWIPALEESAPIIRRELESVLKQDAENQQELFKADSKYQQTMGKGWSAVRLQRLGEWNEDTTQRFPLTTRLIKSLPIPFAMRGVMFAKHDPHSTVKSHSDGRNFILTAHLGLTVPKDCILTVGNEQKEWTPNGMLVFDTSYTYSEENKSDEDRYVLSIDFWHPDLTPAERRSLEWIYDTRNKFESNRASEIDCSWVKQKKPLTTQAYIDSKKGMGAKFVEFFSDGGLVKFNPLK